MIINLYEFDGEDTVVSTERLTLRLLREKDAADILEYVGTGIRRATLEALV